MENVDETKLSTEKTPSDTSSEDLRRARSSVNQDSDEPEESSPRRLRNENGGGQRRVSNGAAAEGAAGEEAFQNIACVAVDKGSDTCEDSCDERSCVSRAADDEYSSSKEKAVTCQLRNRRKNSDHFRSTKKEKRKEYQRLKACLKPSVVPLRTPAVTCFLGVCPAADEHTPTVSAPVSAAVAVSAGALVPTAVAAAAASSGASTVLNTLPSDGAAASCGLLDGVEKVTAAEYRREQGGPGSNTASDVGAKRAAYVLDGQLRVVDSTAGVSMPIGDEDDETWRGSSRSRTSAAGGRTGRFSAAERAAVCAALRQYAIDNGLEGGTVEAAVEHLMSAQDVSSPSTEGKRKRGGRALRFAAITRWLPQRSCASVYFYIRRNLCARLGGKKHGPWSFDEVQTLLKMESELRLSHPRSRFARIAAVLNRTASSVNDKWREVGPRFSSSLGRRNTPLSARLEPTSQHRSLSDASYTKSDGAGAAGLTRTEKVSEDNTCPTVVFKQTGTIERNAGKGGSPAASTAKASLTKTCQMGVHASDAAAGEAEDTEEAGEAQLHQRAEHRSGDVEMQQQASRLHGRRPAEGGEKGASGAESEDSSGDSAAAETDAATESLAAAAAQGGRVCILPDELPSELRSSGRGESAAQVRTASGTSKGELSGAEARHPGLNNEVLEGVASTREPDANRDLAVLPGQSEVVHTGGTQWGAVEDDGQGKIDGHIVTTIEKATVCAVQPMRPSILRRARFGTTEQAQQLLRAIQEQTGECLPATGIKWSSVQRQLFPDTAASQLRLYYTTRLVPQELAKRMGVSAAEPVLLRFVIRCLDSLLKAKRTQHNEVQKTQREGLTPSTRGEGLRGTSLPPPASKGPQQPNDHPVPPTVPHRKDDGMMMTPSALAEGNKYTETAQLPQRVTLNGLIIDSVCDVDWLEILPFCPTALPLFVFRRAVTALPVTKLAESGGGSPPSVKLANQVFMLKERLGELHSNTNAGRDAALLLRAALPREALASAIRHQLRKRRWKKGQPEGHSRMKRPPETEEDQRLHQEALLQYRRDGHHRNCEIGSDKAAAGTAVSGSGCHADASCCDVSGQKAPSDEDADHTIVEGGHIDEEDEEEEEARERATELKMTEAEREKKWHKEERLLGRAAVLAVLRRVGGKEIKRLRRRNRKCLKAKETLDGVKRLSHTAVPRGGCEETHPAFAQIRPTDPSFCKVGRNGVAKYSGRGRGSSSAEECPLVLQLRRLPEANRETCEQPNAADPPASQNQREDLADASPPAQQEHLQSSSIEKEPGLLGLPQSDERRACKSPKDQDWSDTSVRTVCAVEERQQEDISVPDRLGESVETLQQQLPKGVTNSTGESTLVGRSETVEAAGFGLQTSGEVNNATEFSTELSKKHRHKKKRRRAHSNVADSCETEERIAEFSVQCERHRQASDEHFDAVSKQKALSHSDNERRGDPHDMGEVAATRDFNGEKTAHGEREKREKKKRKLVADAKLQPAEGLRHFSPQYSAGDIDLSTAHDVTWVQEPVASSRQPERLHVEPSSVRDQGTVRVPRYRGGTSEQDSTAFSPQPERRKKRKEKKKERVSEGLIDGNTPEVLVVEQEGNKSQTIMPRDQKQSPHGEIAKRKKKKNERVSEGMTDGNNREGLVVEQEGNQSQTIMPRDQKHSPHGEIAKRKKKKKERVSEGLTDGNNREGLVVEQEGNQSQTIMPRDQKHSPHGGIAKRKKKKKERVSEGLTDGNNREGLVVEQEGNQSQTIMPRDQKQSPHGEIAKRKKKKKERVSEGLTDGNNREGLVVEQEGSQSQTIMPRDQKQSPHGETANIASLCTLEENNPAFPKNDAALKERRQETCSTNNMQFLIVPIEGQQEQRREQIQEQQTRERQQMRTDNEQSRHFNNLQQYEKRRQSLQEGVQPQADDWRRNELIYDGDRKRRKKRKRKTSERNEVL